jgi:hypothetical protein
VFCPDRPCSRAGGDEDGQARRSRRLAPPATGLGLIEMGLIETLPPVARPGHEFDAKRGEMSSLPDYLA